MKNASDKFLSLLLTFIFILGLSACGGGGSSGGDNTVAKAFTLPEQGLGGSVFAVVEADDGSGDFYVGGAFASYNDIASGNIIRFNSDGTVDTAFAVGTGFNNRVTTIALASDGSGDIYVGGWFSSYNGNVSNRIIRLNSDGTVDASFDIGNGFSSFVFMIAPATDSSGDVYVGGAFTSYNGTTSNRIIRLNNDGTVDTAFDVGTGFSSNVNTIALAGDGSGDIYVGGYFTTYNTATTSNYIIRLNNDGTVDTAFDVGTGFSGNVNTIALAGDGTGDIYVGGVFSSYNGTTSNRIIRLNNDGTVDSAFAVGTGFDWTLYTITPAADGSGDIYVGGVFSSYNGTPSNSIIRLNDDGTADTNFVVGTGADNTINTIVPATDGTGDIHVGGSIANYNGTISRGLVRLASTGSTSKSYSTNVALDNVANALAPATDGSGDIYVGGSFTSYNGTTSNRIIRLNNDGTVDTAFVVGIGIAGRVTTIAPATDSSGDIYVGGAFTSYNGTISNRIIRLNSDGTVDTAFAVGTGFNNSVTTIALANDGSGDIYVGGTFTSYNGTTSNRIVRLNSDGSVDSAFAVGSGFDSTVYTITPATDGSGDIYVAGRGASYNDTTSNYIIRLNNDGTVDTAFAVGTGFNVAVIAITPAADGSGDIYVGGAFTSYNGTTSNRIIRLNNDGTVDTAFDVGTGFSGNVDTIALASDGTGDIYVAGLYSSYNGTTSNGIIRLKNNGAVDSIFATGDGLVPGGLSAEAYAVIASAMDDSGNIFVAGPFATYDNTTIMGIALLTPDGSLQ